MSDKNKIGQTIGKIIIGGMSVISGISPVPPEHRPIQKPTSQLISVVNQQNKRRRENSERDHQPQTTKQKQ